MRKTISAVALLAAAFIAAPAGAGSREADFAGAATFFGNVIDNTSASSVFRFYNGSRFAGNVRMVLYDFASGTLAATWTSAAIPSGGAIEVSTATIKSGAVPALTATQLAAAFNIGASASFRGTVRQITRSTSALINQSDCGTPVNLLSYVEGPGFPGVTSAVKIINPSQRTGSVTLSLRNAATGVEIGRWTSAAIPSHASDIVSVSAMAAAATPAVPATTTALTIAPVAATAAFGLEHLAAVTGSSVISNLTDACPI